jgi:hypothetical protein
VLGLAAIIDRGASGIDAARQRRVRDDTPVPKDAGGFARPPKAAELIERATAWLKDQSEALTIRICGSVELRGLVENELANREKVLIKIVDILVPKYSGLPLATIGELLFRSGVSSYCASHWAASRGVT